MSRSEIARQRIGVPSSGTLSAQPKLESRIDNHTIMSDLRDSGAIELGTDIVAFVYRDDYCTKEAFKIPSVAKIILTKQSNSQTVKQSNSQTVRQPYSLTYIFNLAWQAA